MCAAACFYKTNASLPLRQEDITDALYKNAKEASYKHTLNKLVAKSGISRIYNTTFCYNTVDT